MRLRLALGAGVALAGVLTACSVSSLPGGSQAQVPPLLTPAKTLAQAPDSYNWSQIEQDILAEQNRVRQDPASYIPLLEERLANMDDQGNIWGVCGLNCRIVTQEGQAAVQEAIAFLRQQAGLNALSLSSYATQAAQAHAADQADGATGHSGSDGSSPSDRLERTGAIYTRVGENIAYGSRTGQDVILDLIVDDGVPDRGHRINIFSPHWTDAGAGCGPHAVYDIVCVINYTTTSNQLTIQNQGTTVLQSVVLSGIDLLKNPLLPGQGHIVILTDGQCKADLQIQLEGYRPTDWADLTLCGATLTVDAQNGFDLSYGQ